MLHIRHLLLLSVVLLGLLGPACPQVAAAKYILKFAGPFGLTHPATKSMEAFKACLAEASDGQIEVQLYPNNQLGGEELLMKHIRRGSVQMALVGGLLKKDEPKIAVMEAPFIINSWAQAKRVYSGRGGDILAGNYTANTGVYIKGWFVNGFRQISSCFPVESLADIAKMTIRMPINDVFVRTFKTFGAKTIIVPMNELYTALENKVADGQDNPYSTVRANGWYEVQTHLMETRHMFSTTAVLVNGNFYDSLPENLQKSLDACVESAVELNWKLAEEDDEASRNFLQERGLKVFVPTPEMQQQLRDIVKPMYDWFYAEVPGSREFIEYCTSMQ